MARGRSPQHSAAVWPAFTDAMLAFSLVLVLMIAYQIGRAIELAPQDRQRVADQARIAALIEEFRESHGLDIQLSQDGNRQEITFGSDVTFASGSDQLLAEGRELITQIANEITGAAGDEELQTLQEIQVHGHTDDVPIGTVRFPSNWELSTARATRVVRFLVEQGVDPGGIQLSSAGYGEFSPRESNLTEEGRAANRRIELRLTYTDVLTAPD